jgi:uncharacterized repeat protein (TIGR03847 family)
MTRHYDFGHPALFDVDSVGRPGSRRFRFVIRSHDGMTASLWVERQHLERLCEVIDKLLAELNSRQPLVREAQAGGPPPGAPADFPRSPTVEFPVERLSLDFNPQRLQLALHASASGDEDDEDSSPQAPRVSVTFGCGLADRLSNHIARLLSTGRVRCPYCGYPMQEQHLCEPRDGIHPAVLN